MAQQDKSERLQQSQLSKKDQLEAKLKELKDQYAEISTERNRIESKISQNDKFVKELEYKVSKATFGFS